MSAAEKAAFLMEVIAAHSDPQDAMSESRMHVRAKNEALDALRLHYKKTRGRTIYLAEELAVVYPGQPTFAPDILAVLDVAEPPEPEEDRRTAWVVADEGKGLDLVIEVLHLGSRDKDLGVNVDRYAELGIREYFVYDRLHGELHGFRLPSPGARRYRRLRARLGRIQSQVLNLDLALVQGRLRFFSGPEELIGSGELIDKLEGMMERKEARIATLEAQIEAAQNEAAQERQARQQAEQRTERAEQHAQQAQKQALEGVVKAVTVLCGTLGIELTAERRTLLLTLDLQQLLSLIDRLQTERTWPLSGRQRAARVLH